MSNRCDTCDHRKVRIPDHGGHCYMFREEPETCGQHTARRRPTRVCIGHISPTGGTSFADVVLAMAGTTLDFVIFDELREAPSDVEQVKPPPRRYGPPKRGAKGKIKRW